MTHVDSAKGHKSPRIALTLIIGVGSDQRPFEEARIRVEIREVSGVPPDQKVKI